MEDRKRSVAEEYLVWRCMSASPKYVQKAAGMVEEKCAER